jgi:putative intracellular protease/amidase
MRVRVLVSTLVTFATALAATAPTADAASARVPEPAQVRALTGDKRVVVLLADNAGTETTDLLAPHAILKRTGAFEVIIVAAADRPVELMPALKIEVDMTIDGFNRRHPAGADLVIVPAFHGGGDETSTAFLQDQAAKGAMVAAICEGAEPVAKAGLFAGRAATTHWYAFDRLAADYAATDWRRDSRYIVDGPVVSSAGVSASVPVTLALIEILGGRELAERTAAGLEVDAWTAEHDSSAFTLTVDTVLLALGNMLAFWRHEDLDVPVDPGFDGLALALQADAWSRTYRSPLIARNASGRVVSSDGVAFLTAEADVGDAVISPRAAPPLQALDQTLAAIAERYGAKTASFVALQLEYPWPQTP